MFRLVIASVLSLVALTASAAQAGTSYTDPQGRFTVAVPEGWRAAKPDTDQRLGLVMIKTSTTGLFGICLFIISETPLTKSKTQAEVDDGVTAEMTKEFWEAGYKAQGGEDVVVEDIGNREKDGRKVQYVTIAFTTKGTTGTGTRFKIREEVHAIPGRLHDVGCMTEEPKFEEAKAEFETILNSYTPQSGLIVQAPVSEPAVATLFANANFAGVARVVSSAIPNVTALGWPAQAGSVTVSGFGEWQVCEGANYTGKCTVIVGARTAAPNTLMRVGSLRPYVSPPGTRGIASVIATDTMFLINEAVKQLSRRP